MDAVSNTVGKLADAVTPKHVEKVTLRPQIVTWKIPAPHPTVSGPTPDELHLIKQSTKAAAATEATEAIHAGADDVTGEGRSASQRAKGAWSVVRNFTKRTGLEMSATVSRVTRDRSINADVKTFLEEFPDVANAGAVHISAHTCLVTHEGAWHPTAVHVTSTHICFSGAIFNDAIPLKNLASIIPSVSLPTVDGSPLLVEVPDKRVITKALQLYTTTKKCYMLTGFDESVRHKLANTTVSELTPLNMFYTTVDRAWRAETTVPLSGVEYAASSQQ